MKKDQNIDQLGSRITKALESNDVPKIYFNGFVTTIGSGDILLILEQNGSPVTSLNMSYTVAKTLAIKLMDTIQRFEMDTGNTLLTTDDIAKTLTKKVN